MINPTTKDELLARMHTDRQELLDLLSRIPDAHMDEIALYDAWSIKDFIAHIGWWAQTGAERIAMSRRGEIPPPIDDYDAVNADVLERFRDISLSEARDIEKRGFAAIQTQTQELSEDEIFHTHMGWIRGPTYAHYEEHIDDVKAWMQQNGFDR
jgi:hypothetical protein